MNRSWVNGEPILTVEEMDRAMHDACVEQAAIMFGVEPGNVSDEMLQVYYQDEDDRMREAARLEGWL